jgi:predicted amidohydrolase YtcJ
MQDCQGTLVPGAWADIAAWNEDPLEVEADALTEIECVATLVGGTPVIT